MARGFDWGGHRHRNWQPTCWKVWTMLAIKTEDSHAARPGWWWMKTTKSLYQLWNSFGLFSISSRNIPVAEVMVILCIKESRGRETHVCWRRGV